MAAQCASSGFSSARKPEGKSATAVAWAASKRHPIAEVALYGGSPPEQIDGLDSLGAGGCTV